MKHFPIAIAFLILAAAAAFAQGRVDFQASDTIRSVLERHTGQRVELRIEGSEKLTGKVEKVGDRNVYLSAIAGQEFYDAVVSLEEIAAVLIRTR